MTPSKVTQLQRSMAVKCFGRRNGIGYAIAKEFIARGATVFAAHCERHDREQPWGSDWTGTSR